MNHGKTWITGNIQILDFIIKEKAYKSSFGNS